MTGLISVETLSEWMKNDSDSLRIIDCRFDLTNTNAGETAFKDEHITGAQYVHLDRDLSGEVGKHGGRHPLPKIEQLVQVVECLGIQEDSTVIAYDDQGGAFASRFWWLMKLIGHEKVYVLNGGFTSWKAKGLPTSDELITYAQTSYKPSVNWELLATVEHVRNAVNKQDTLLIDSREWTRYIGEQEPIDPKAGHIPSALNHFWKHNLQENGEFLPKQALQKMYQRVKEKEEVIVYCGSGVTACPNVLALLEAGIQNVKLYAGSWSDWITYDENDVETTNGKQLLEIDS